MRVIVTNVHVFMQSTRYCCQILKKIEFSGQTFKKKSQNIKFLDNPCSGCPVVPCSQMHRRKDMAKIIVAFHNFANALKNWLFTEICLVQWLLPWRDWVLRILLAVGLGKTKRRQRAPDMDLKIRKTKAISNWIPEPKTSQLAYVTRYIMWPDILCDPIYYVTRYIIFH